MNFKEMLEKRHACKLFDGRKIPEEDLKFILESGVLAPSSHGFEPWKFFVLNDRQEELSKLCFNQQIDCQKRFARKRRLCKVANSPF